MANNIYVGNSDQQQLVIDALTTDVRRFPQGIFVVGGGGRVGKSTALIKTVGNLDIPIIRQFGSVVRPDLQMYDDEPDLYFSEWEEAYGNGTRLFAFGEVPIQFAKSLNWLRSFYEKAIEVDSEKIKILFNVISRKHPAWKNQEVENDIAVGMSRIFQSDLHFNFLQADPELIIKELWELHKQDRMGYLIAADQLGFKTRSFQFLEATDSGDINDYRQRLMRIMNEGPTQSPELKY